MAKSQLESQLKEHGCETPIVQFQDYLESEFPQHYSYWTVDELLLHPEEAHVFCNAIRRNKEFEGLPDELILRALLARRKNPI